MADKETGANSVLAPSEDGRQCNADMEKLLETGDLSDFELIVGHTRIPVHKCILAARSTFFAAIFRHSDMWENHENLVGIEELEPEVARELLRYLYSGRVRDLSSMWSELLVAAKRFDVRELKELCEQHGCSILKEEDALDMLQFAHRHGAYELKKQAAEMVVRRADKFRHEPEWKELDRDLVDEIVAMMAHELEGHRLAGRR